MNPSHRHRRRFLRAGLGLLFAFLPWAQSHALPTVGAAVLAASVINPDAPYSECHAATLAETLGGELVAAWFGGTKERHPDVGIWFARHDGNRWAPATEVANGLQADGSRLPTWNPVLFQDPAGPLLLFYKVGPSPSRWWGMLLTSTDGGVTWSSPRRLPEGVLGPVKNKPVILADGSWLSPSSVGGTPTGWRVHFEHSRDRGATWRRIGPVEKGPGFDGIQPSILLHSAQVLQALGRTRQGVVFQTWSRDGGETWTPLTATSLPNPNAGTDAVTLADGRHLLVYNPVGHRADEPKGDRFPLAVAIARDGLNWSPVLTLETVPVVSGYAYPAVIQARDGRVHIAYTAGRKAIRHVVLDPARL